MTEFYDWLQQQNQYAPLSTEDVLSAFLPLMRQVIQTHAAGYVAPLESLRHLHVQGNGIQYAIAEQRPLRKNVRQLQRLLQVVNSGVEVVGQRRVVRDVDDGIQEDVDLAAITTQSLANQPPDRPVYVAGYVCWEHLIDHHDPATDVFSLGLILASLACGLDLAQQADHERFVKHRRNLFAIQPELHPVLARSIVVMTELDRHQRPQDLAALLITLENYRDQEVDFETDLASDLQLSDRPNRREVILNKLQQRLFEINRRNRLLQFRSTLQTINLTQASIPVSFAPDKIQASQLVTWSGRFRDQLLRQKPVSLNSFLNFREAVYLPGTLDRLRAEARRDETEYGFVQLRLIIAFLRWSDLKAATPEQYESPLLLLPVRLDIKKGIHDRYTLTAMESTAEVNPVIRHLFRQLYDIDLPEQVTPDQNGIKEFHEQLRQKIQASDSAVELSRIEKPRIELIHEKARRRLDQFRRRAALSGRGIRCFHDLDYSYDSINYHPLGARIFESLIKPAATHLEDIVTTNPAQRKFMTESQDDGHDSASDSGVVEAQQQFYSLQQDSDNPWHWEFDLCSVTLSNLKYRRMSLVRDYTRLVTDSAPNAAFEATFSATPVGRVSVEEPEIALEDRFHVVACDPTQSQAITHARSGESYIIQGPPGTGKSQTITNLIADFVRHGRRVLFVCEKRAAIDVVYHRLKQQGLHELCCLIHDSQADKKSFVMDLKETYNAFLAEGRRKRDSRMQHRDKLVQRIQQSLQPVASFNTHMTSTPPGAGVPLRSLLDLLIQLREKVPSLLPQQWERVPDYADFVTHESALHQFAERLSYLQPDGILAHHSLCLLSPDLLSAERPVEVLVHCLNECLSGSDDPQSSAEHNDGRIDQLIARLELLQLPIEVTSSVTALQQAMQYAQRASLLSESDLLSMLDSKSKLSKSWTRRLNKYRRCQRAVEKAMQENTAWQHKLNSSDTKTALQLATALEHSVLRFLYPAWWKLRKTLHRSLDFSRFTIRPSYRSVLMRLDEEHDRLAERYEIATVIGDEFGIQLELDQFDSQLKQLRTESRSLSPALQNLQTSVLQREDGAETLRMLAALQTDLQDLCQLLDNCLEDYQTQSLTELRDTLRTVGGCVDQVPDYLHCLKSLQPVPEKLAAAIRTIPLTLTELQAASAERILQAAYREDRDLSMYSSTSRTRHMHAVATACDSWLQANAAAIRELVQQRFNDYVRLTDAAASTVEKSQMEFRSRYRNGRKALEHEFGKSMRYRSIRDLATGDPGTVIRDLKPVWLMSPLSVSDTLPLQDAGFDVVIFDEASQIRLEEAIPSLFRAPQTIVVGDEMQLPPTAFFSSGRSEDSEDDLELRFEEDGEVVQYDLNSSSFLNHSSRNLPTRTLGWHYRSRSESLISFSNHAFYGGRLLTVPEERLPSDQQPALHADCAQDAVSFADELMKRPVSFHLLRHGVYERRRNTAEAEYIAELVRRLLLSENGQSIAVIAFSEAQQTEIERALQELADGDSDFADRLATEQEREDDGQFTGLLVKNLENIQGDERDIVILSVCYGPDPNGRIRMSFGPINMSGGEKRLNVAFSRAKQHMALVTSIKSADITNDYNDGANCLKNYLKYAEACSTGHSQIVDSVLQTLSGSQHHDTLTDDRHDTVVEELADWFSEQGYRVDRNVGQSHFRCDLAVCQPQDSCYQLGLLVDTHAWYAQPDLLERELMKPRLMQDFGWHVHVVLAKDWYQDRDQVLTEIRDRLAPMNEVTPDGANDVSEDSGDGDIVDSTNDRIGDTADDSGNAD